MYTSSCTRWFAASALWVAGSLLPLAASAAPQHSQLVIKVADVPEQPLGGGVPAKGKGEPKREAPFTVKVLADPTNVHAQQISLTQLTVGPASRVAMHRHPRSAKVLYLLRGHARLLGPSGVAPVKLDEGMLAFVPAGYPHVIENMGRQSTAVFLQAFMPPGPERVYRDPKDPAGRADFEVIRDPASAKLPPESSGRVVVVDSGSVQAAPIVNGKGTTKVLLDAQSSGIKDVSVSLHEFNSGAELARHVHANNTEVLFVMTGGGKLTIGNEVSTFGPQELIYLPAAQPHALHFTGGEKAEKIEVLEMFAPAMTITTGASTTPTPSRGGSGR